MWISNILIVINSRNADRNTLSDLAAAATEVGAQVVAIDEQKHVIEAAIQSQDLPLIAAMDGVAYVRCVFTYFCDLQAPVAA